jgi:hypothetical protein
MSQLPGLLITLLDEDEDRGGVDGKYVSSSRNSVSSMMEGLWVSG